MDRIERNSKADAIREINGSLALPSGYYQRPDGLIAPDRLRNTEPRITINGTVNQDMFRSLSDTLQRISENHGVINGLQVNFSSFGGQVTSGFGIYDLLTVFGRELDIPISITGYGPVSSMAALILQAGDIRRMPRNSRMLLHPVTTDISGDVNRVGYEIEATKAQYTLYTQVMSERLIRAGHNTTPEDVRALMEANSGAGTYFTSEQALTSGLIDEIV